MIKRFHPRLCIVTVFFLFACQTAGYAQDPANSNVPRGQRAGETDPPNIVVFLADDAGWNDVGYHGSEVQTPNVDRLAREGVQLEQFYVYPVCSPTRAALLTGRPPSRFGILGASGGNSKLEKTTTLADVLSQQGYHTAITGKWHLGVRPELRPQHHGFDYSYGYLHGQVDPYTHRYKFGDTTWHRNGAFIREAGHATDLIAGEAIRFIEELRDEERPFFLYVPFSVPHYPLHEPGEYIDLYRDSIANRSRQRFAASMTHMDEAIGKILSSLREEGLEQNTLVIFASDNGGQRSWSAPGDQYVGRYAAHDRLGDNAPLRGWKGGVYEGGIRVPAVASWPGRLERRVVSEPVSVNDLMPTLARLAGAAITGEMQVEGIDIWPVLSEGREVEKRPLYWRRGHAMALRLGDWKLIHQGGTLEEGEDELYNLARDPQETKEVAGEHPEKLAELRKLLEAQGAKDR